MPYEIICEAFRRSFAGNQGLHKHVSYYSTMDCIIKALDTATQRYNFWYEGLTEFTLSGDYETITIYSREDIPIAQVFFSWFRVPAGNYIFRRYFFQIMAMPQSSDTKSVILNTQPTACNQ